jgi:hypothetical protein
MGLSPERLYGVFIWPSTGGLLTARLLVTVHRIEKQSFFDNVARSYPYLEASSSGVWFRFQAVMVPAYPSLIMT